MGEPSRPETADERAERLLRIALSVAVRIRDEPADAAARELDGLDARELRDLAVLASACIDVSLPLSKLTWWADMDRLPAPSRAVRPCGTHTAFNRHKARGETPCAACQIAERDWQAQRWQARKAAAQNGGGEVVQIGSRRHPDRTVAA